MLIGEVVEMKTCEFLRLNTFPVISGIACIALSFVDAQGRPLQVPAQDCAALQRSDNCTTPLHPEHFNELTSVVKVESVSISSGKHNSGHIFTVKLSCS